MAQFRWNPKTGSQQEVLPMSQREPMKYVGGTGTGGRAAPNVGGDTWAMNAFGLNADGGLEFFAGPDQWKAEFDDMGGGRRGHGYGGGGYFDPAQTARPGRFGNYGGRFAPPSPNALDANGRPGMGSLEGLYNMQRPGAGPTEALQNRAQFEQAMATYPTRPMFPQLRPYAPFGMGGGGGMPGSPMGPSAMAGLAGMFNPALGAAMMAGPGMMTGYAPGMNYIKPGEIPKLAAGGPTKKVQPYIVGERGPELFVPEVDGKIVPHKKTKEMIGEAVWEVIPPETRVHPGMMPPKHRYMGGPVRGYGASQVPPWAMQPRGQMPFMQSQMPAFGGFAPQINEFQMLQSPTLHDFWANNPNAPDLPGMNSALARYVRMGIQQRSRLQAARQAVAQTYAGQAADQQATAMDVPNFAAGSFNGSGWMNGQYGRGASGPVIPEWARGLQRLAPVSAPRGSWQETQALQALMAQRAMIPTVPNNPYRGYDPTLEMISQ